MSSGSVAETKNNLSAILAKLECGSEVEHVIKKRDVPIAVIVSYQARTDRRRTFGFAKDDGKVVDWEAFDTLDSEIAELFGA